MDLVLSVDEDGCAAACEASSGTASCEVVPPAFDDALFHCDGAVTARRRRVVHVGRVEWGKRIDLLVEALKLLHSRDDRWEAVIIGDGSERPALETLACDLGVAPVCRFVGWLSREELPAELRRSSLFVLPSMSEGVTTAVIESLACGTPALTRPLSGLVDVVEPGENGEFWYGDDAASLAAAIEAAESAVWSPEAVAASVRRFSCESVIGRVDALLSTAHRRA
jgi:glycosyltransferase involved in cell wall biosynthesis